MNIEGPKRVSFASVVDVVAEAQKKKNIDEQIFEKSANSPSPKISKNWPVDLEGRTKRSALSPHFKAKRRLLAL